MMKDQINLFNNKILDLWSKYYPNDEDVFIPIMLTQLKRNCHLYIGLNPSFSERGFKTIVAGTEYENINPTKYFHWKKQTRIQSRKSSKN